MNQHLLIIRGPFLLQEMVPAKAAPVKAITVNGKPTADETSEEEEEESEPEEEPKVQFERFVIWKSFLPSCLQT